jgi:hypothetical protein
MKALLGLMMAVVYMYVAVSLVSLFGIKIF